MRFVILLHACVLLASGSALAAVDRFNVTPEEHVACDGDAIALCASTYPDQDKLLACMKLNRAQLSPTCNAAFISGLKRRGIRL